MKIRSREELVDFLSVSHQRRKHELVSVGQHLPPHAPQPLEIWRRISVVLAYAHWEGFVKDAASAYVTFVGRKAVPLESLRPCFQAVVCRPEVMGAAGASKRIGPHLKIVRRLVDDIRGAVSIPAENVVDTESNLTWAVFENILDVIGIDTRSQWAPYRGVMDDMFLARCAVAHGQLETPSAHEATQYLSFAMDALEQFNTDIVNAAYLGTYLRAPPSSEYIPEIGRLDRRPT